MKTTMLVSMSLAHALLPSQAHAQDHSQHQVPMPATQDHSQHEPATPKAKADAKAQQAPAQPVDHAAMGHEMPSDQNADAMQGMDHSTMDHAAMGHAMPRPADEPRTPIPIITDADREAAKPPASAHPAHGDSVQSFVLFNRLEGVDADEGRGLAWEGQAWVGGDINKLWLRSEGERSGGHTESADLEVLYGRAVARWWDVVAGVRHDFKPGQSQDFLAVGVMGLAPYKFEVAATAYLGQSGQTAARLEAEYETLLTNRLILQPLVEVEFHGKNDATRGIGAGLGTAEAGVRLRYEVTRRFAPYIGVVREWSFGRTADFRRADGEAVHDTRIVAGLRVWF